MTCNLSFIVNNLGVLEVVVVSRVHLKSGSISGTELDRHWNKATNRTWYTAYLKAQITMTLGV